jgi:cytochrome c biogenesis protein CcmG/thiol:disulfide interchange protein DsbE
MTEELNANNTAEPSAQADLPDWLQDMTGDEPRQPDAAAQVEQIISTSGVVGMLAIVALLIMLGYLLYQRSQGTVTEGPAPKFTISVFDHEPLDNYGEQIKLADLQGRVVVINFWASYCGPCRDEAVMLEMLYREYKAEGVVFLGINTDDIESNALDYLNEYGITYPNAPDKGGKIEDDYRTTGIPETFVVGKDGEITWHIPAPIVDGGRDLRAEIDQALRG